MARALGAIQEELKGDSNRAGLKAEDPNDLEGKPMIPRRIASRVVPFVFLLVAFPACAGELFLDGVSLRLGMPKADVLAALAPNHVITPPPEGSGMYTVTVRGEEGGPPYRLVGTVSFTRGRLSSASKSWITSKPDARELFDGLFGPLAELTAGSDRMAKIGTKVQREPGSERRWITIEIPPDKIINVSVLEDATHGSGFAIQETLVLIRR